MRFTEAHYPSLLLMAIVAAIFSAVVCAILLVDYRQRSVDLAAEVPQIQSLKTELAERPDDKELRETIRAIDLRVRDDYFRHRRFVVRGAFLLSGGVVLALVAARLASALRRRLPMPPTDTPQADRDTRISMFGRWAVGGLTLLLIGTVIALQAGIRSRLPATIGELAQLASRSPDDRGGGIETGTRSATPPVEAPPSLEEVARNWSRFRGPHGAGISTSDEALVAWDGATGEGIIWKTQVPVPGNSSPIVWEDHLFLTGATEDQRVVYCFDTKTGDLAWQKEMPAASKGSLPPKVSEETGYAAPTAATDGRRVYVAFANGDVAALDFKGNRIWQSPLGTPKNIYGFASSPTTYKDLLIVQFDQGSRKDDLSRLIAFHSATGEIAWETPRQVPNSWPSPIVIEHAGKPQIITCADPWVVAYDPESGAEVWRAKSLSKDVGPSPVYSDGTIFVANEFPALSAIQAGGEGDVTETHVRWTADVGLPDTCCPVVVNPFVLVLASYGTLTCYDGATGGEPLWEMDFDDNFRSSPSLVGQKVYIFGEGGRSWVVEVDRENGQIVGEGDLGEPCVTSPAILGGRIYIRGEEHVFCIGKE